MPKKVYCNVVKHRLLDNKKEIEDVTKVGLPTIAHPTTTVKSSGMVADVDMPDTTHLDAMELTVYHNNGVNCRYLSDPGKHNFDMRVARQQYNVPKGELGAEGFKVRVIAVHVKTEKGDVESGNPLGYTERYSVLRYEEEQNGDVITVIDAMAGILKWNGKDYTSDVDNLLK